METVREVNLAKEPAQWVMHRTRVLPEKPQARGSSIAARYIVHRSQSNERVGQLVPKGQLLLEPSEDHTKTQTEIPQQGI
eukprot:3207372-Alexandrium_andersonii.AAC.1